MVLWQQIAGMMFWWAGVSTLSTPVPTIDPSLLPTSFGDHCGYVDAQGRFAINPRFEVGGFFSPVTGLAAASLGGKWGLINRQGEFVVNPQFDGIEEIAGQRLFIVRLGERAGIIDAQGTFVVRPQFEEISGFDTQGRSVAVTGERAGIIDLRGNFVVPPQFDSINWRGSYAEVVGFKRGLVAAQVEGRWGYIDERGNWVIRPQFARAGHFGFGGLAAVRIARAGSEPPRPLPPNAPVALESSAAPGEWGYIDRAGRFIVAPQFNAAMEFSDNGLAAVDVHGRMGFIDRTGAMRIDPQYIYAGPFIRTDRGWTAVVSISAETDALGRLIHRMGAIDEAGRYRINPQFDSLETFDVNRRSVAQIGNMRGLVDDMGRYVASPSFSELRLMNGSLNYYYVKTSETVNYHVIPEFGWIDASGRTLSAARGALCW